MTGDPQVLLYGVYGSAFLAVVLLVCGLAAWDAARRARRAARLRRLGAAPVPGAERERLRRAGPALGLGRSLARLAEAAAPETGRRLAALVMGMAVLALVGLGTAAVMLRSLPWPSLALAVPLVLALLAVSVLAALRVLAARRRRRFAAQLPDALDAMVRSLRAGHPVSGAMAMVRRELSDPIAAEFGRAIDEMTYGLELRQALARMAARVDVAELRFVVASVSLQHETGGNLAELLQGLADLMRARSRVARKVRAYTAEARLSARFLAIMPVVFVGLVLAANPEVYGEAARDPLFWPVLLGAGALQVLGILVMGRMARVRV